MSVNLTGIWIVIFELLHIADGNRIAQPRPVTVHVRVAVVVGAVHSSNIVAVRVIEFGEIPFQHCQVAQSERIHTIELYPIRQKAVLSAILEGHHAVQLLLGVPASPHGAVVLLSDELQGRRSLTVDAAAPGNTALGVYGVNDLFRHPHLVIEAVPTGLELARVGQNKVAGGEAGHIFVHVEAACEGYSQGQQHHSKGQGQHSDKGLAPAAAQIGPGHGQ